MNMLTVWSGILLDDADCGGTEDIIRREAYAPLNKLDDENQWPGKDARVRRHLPSFICHASWREHATTVHIERRHEIS